MLTHVNMYAIFLSTTQLRSNWDIPAQPIYEPATSLDRPIKASAYVVAEILNRNPEAEDEAKTHAIVYGNAGAINDWYRRTFRTTSEMITARR